MLRALLLLTAIIAAVDGTSAQELEGRLKQIHDTGIVRLAYRSDANPFSFVSQNGRPEGYTIDLCKFIASALGRELKKISPPNGCQSTHKTDSTQSLPL